MVLGSRRVAVSVRRYKNVGGEYEQWVRGGRNAIAFPIPLWTFDVIRKTIFKSDLILDLGYKMYLALLCIWPVLPNGLKPLTINHPFSTQVNLFLLM